MEVMDSPLNRAHHYSRKADRLIAKEKYEEAILCHSDAAELLEEALTMTKSEQVRLSLMLQRERHLQLQRLIQMSCSQAHLKKKNLLIFSKQISYLSAPCPLAFTRMSTQTILEHETQRPPLGCKAAKDDKTRLEEQSTSIADLWKLVAFLLKENEELSEEHEKLKVENAHLKENAHPCEEHSSPLPSIDVPDKMSMNLVRVSSNLQERIRHLWERANES